MEHPRIHCKIPRWFDSHSILDVNERDLFGLRKKQKETKGRKTKEKQKTVKTNDKIRGCHDEIIKEYNP